jgi:hypothetical protein
MEMNCDRVGTVETIELSRRPSLVAMVVIAMGALLVLQVILMLATRSMTITLMALLTVAAGSAGWLAVLALEAIMPVNIKMDKDGLTVGRLLGAATHPWADIVDAKVVPSSGMLSDDPKAEQSGRLGVGLFLKSRKTPRAHALDADVMLFGAPETELNTLISLCDHVVDFKRTIGAGRPDPGSRIRKAVAIAAPTAFRRPRSAA